MTAKKSRFVFVVVVAYVNYLDYVFRSVIDYCGKWSSDRISIVIMFDLGE